jgi:biopolymer transport protein ExbD
MKKVSKSAHHSLTELNITPLLDLAFVLLVIFIITTAPIANEIDIKLPQSAKNEKDPPRKVNYITVEAGGDLYLNRRKLNVDELLQEMVQMRSVDPDLNVIVRGDSKTKYRHVVAVLDALQRANVVKADLATEARK